MRLALATLGVGLIALFAASAGRVHAATPATFTITGGSVTIELANDLLSTLANDEAVLTTAGGAKLSLSKTKQRLLTLPVGKGTLQLAGASRTLQFTMRGSLVVTGNGTTATLTQPYFLAGVGTDQVGFVVRGTRTAVVEFPKIALPGSFRGATFTLSGLDGIVPSGLGWVFAGYAEHPGDAGNGPAPHFGSTGEVRFGTLYATLKVKRSK